MYNVDLAKKVIFIAKQEIFFRFSDFSPKARGPLKIFNVQFSDIFKKKNSKNDFSGTCQVLRGTKSGILVSLALALRKQQKGLGRCGAF